MSTGGYVMADDWRERYLQLADRHEREAAQFEEAGKDFTRLITRLCVAVSGLDAGLDPHLERLRNVARTGKTDALLRQAGDLADDLMRASEDRVQPNLLQQLLQRAKLAQREQDEVMKLWAKAQTNPAKVDNKTLDRLTELLGKALDASAAPAAAETKSGGLLSRLVGKSPSDIGTPPNQALLELLQSIEWPNHLAEEVEEFRSALSGEAKRDAWVDVVRKISDLVLRAMEQAHVNAQTAETFLNELSERLLAFDQHMLDEGGRREESRESGKRLGEQMNSEVVSLSASVRDSVDLAQLQASVLGSLDRMHAHVRAHLDDENARREKAETEAGELRQQLNQLERDTFDLRREVAQTYQEAMCDALTGLPNRRAYDERIAQEFARWKRFGEPLALLVWDVDDFKKLNDTFGHKAGDRALAMVAKTLTTRLRETDFLARYGGEEFVLVFIGASPKDALKVADVMRQAIENIGLHSHGKPVKLTVSGGMSAFAEGDDPEKVFERADKALYDAKHQGKNRVVAN